MGDDRAAELLAHARELEQRDLDVAARIDTVGRLLAEVDEIRSRAARTRDALAALPADLEQARGAQSDALRRERDARQELADAEHRREDVGRSRRAGEDARVAAERDVQRAATAAADATANVARAAARLETLAAEEIALRAAADGLAVAARGAAASVADLPRVSDSGRLAPGDSLDEIDEWGARAHAALFVVRGGLEDERERVVLEAGTLAASALGEQVAGASVALVRKRLEQSLS